MSKEEKSEKKIKSGLKPRMTKRKAEEQSKRRQKSQSHTMSGLGTKLLEEIQNI